MITLKQAIDIAEASEKDLLGTSQTLADPVTYIPGWFFRQQAPQGLAQMYHQPAGIFVRHEGKALLIHWTEVQILALKQKIVERTYATLGQEKVVNKKHMPKGMGYLDVHEIDYFFDQYDQIDWLASEDGETTLWNCFPEFKLMSELG